MDNIHCAEILFKVGRSVDKRHAGLIDHRAAAPRLVNVKSKEWWACS